MRKSYLNDLCRRYSKTALASFQDTTDVSSFQRLMAEHCGQLPLGVLLAYAHTHVVFNQDHLLQSFIQQKAYHLQFEEEREVEKHGLSTGASPEAPVDSVGCMQV